jgi:hypothetical protein
MPSLLREMRVNARSLGLQFHGLNAGTDQDIDTIFAGLIQQRIGVLLVSADPFFLQLTPEQQSFRRHLAIRRQRRAAPWNGAAHAPSTLSMFIREFSNEI